MTIRPTPPRARSAKYAASSGRCLARSSRPVCIEPITTRLRSVVPPTVERCEQVGVRRSCGDSCSAGGGLEWSTPVGIVGVEVLGEPLDPELLEADAAAEHEVDVELAARQGARARGSRGRRAARSARAGSAWSARWAATWSSTAAPVAVRRGAQLHRDLAAERLHRGRLGQPAGQLRAAGRRRRRTPSCRPAPAARRARSAPSRRPPSGRAPGRSAGGWPTRRSRSSGRSGGSGRARTRVAR